jgi:hypothetical protein
MKEGHNEKLISGLVTNGLMEILQNVKVELLSHHTQTEFIQLIYLILCGGQSERECDL